MVYRDIDISLISYLLEQLYDGIWIPGNVILVNSNSYMYINQKRDRKEIGKRKSGCIVFTGKYIIQRQTRETKINI